MSYYSFLQFNLSIIKCNYSGVLESISGGECSINEELNLPNDDCIFVADGPSELVSSVMALPYLSGTGQWCDSTEDKLHNADIPTKHNTMCDARSVFDVVLQSPDFSGYEPRNQTNITTTFTILQPRELNEPFVFVLDNSGSMDNHNRLNRLKEGVNRFMMIDVDLEKELPIGVVSFAENSKLEYPITPVDDESVRDDIIKTVQDNVRGVNPHLRATCINRGVQESLKALRDYGYETGGLVLFLTDGQHSVKECGANDWLDAIIDDVMDSGARFCTVAFSNDADKNLEELARR